MPALAPNNTKRFYLDYTSGSHQHVLIMRTADSVVASAAQAAFDAFLTIVDPDLKTIGILGMRSQAAHSSVSVPEAWTGPTSYGGGVPNDKDAASYISFVGRSAGGHRVRVTVFSAPVPDDDNNFRIPRADSTLVDAAVAYLAGASNVWLAVDGTAAFWNQYANTGVNAHFRNKFR